MRNLFPAPFVLVYSKRFSLTKKRKYVRTKTPLRLNQNCSVLNKLTQFI